MKKFSFALVLLAFCTLSFFSQPPKRPVGKVAAVRVNAPREPKNTRASAAERPSTLGITVEKYAVTYDVNADGTAVQTWEMQQRFDSEVVIERFKKFERAFNGDLQKAEVLDAYILKADGRRLALAAGDVEIKPTPQAEAAPSFSSYKQVEIAYRELAKGDATYFKIRLTTLEPHFDKQFDMLEVFPRAYGWKSVEVNLTAPADFPLYVQAVELDGGKLSDENGRARWRWRRENLKAFEIEPNMSDFFSSSPRIAATSFKDFDALGAAYWAETKKKAVLTPEVQKLADEITKGLQDPAEQAYAIYEWVNKNVRYLSIVLDKGGWIPHTTSEILANRSGDCKDYSTILYALLKAKGIESYPVLIRSEMGNWFPEVAVTDYFNHAILYIPSLKLFADATAPNTRLGQIMQTIVGKKAILAGERTGVIEMPKDNPADNQLLSEVEIVFEPNGDLRAVSKNTYDGRTEIAFRPLFADAAIQKNPEGFVKTLLAYFGVYGSGKLVKVGNPFKVGEPFSVELEVDLPNFTTFAPKGALPLPVAVNMLNARQLEQYVKPKQRRTNLVLGATRFRESFKLNFPEGVKIEALPPKIDFANAVGSYRNDFAFDGAGVRVLRELVITKDVISPAEYPLVRELIAKSVEGSNAELRYSANPNLARLKSRAPARKPERRQQPESFADFLAGETDEKPLTAAQAAQAEAKLSKTPADLETRKRLLRFYSNYETEDTPARRQNRLKHRLWLLQNRPEIDETDIYSYKSPFYEAGEPDYRTLRDEWLKQTEAAKTNARIRLNAVDFISPEEPEIAEKLLAEGRRIDAQNYEFPLLLSALLFEKSEAPDRAGETTDKNQRRRNRNIYLEQAYEAGETALALLKKERSAERDAKRAGLLQSLAKIAFELEKLDRAKALATELILDFGQDAESSSYTEAAHFGNILLGRAALRENDSAKAREYLLIAIRAPLRSEKSYFGKIDLELAKELFERGEKEAVAEYLNLCEKLLNQSEVYAGKVRALKTWREQIGQGKTPSLDFGKN
ncbi:MAG TPA: DUF3857 domain-containing protein [Pyrinomonadaceae bacterium]|jgi:hypothetical protein